MSTAESPLVKDNEDLTRVGPGTVMGTLMRQYWLPALKSSELEAGGAPVRLLLLGEKLVAARSPKGVVSVLDHRCPHRNASLFFGRNEEGGMRCVYHGWQFDETGQCVEMPNVVDGERFRQRVRATAYRAQERHGVVWVFMGDPAKVPPLPGLEILDAEEGDIEFEWAQRESNYLQSLEGDIDTSHLGFLHLGGLEPEDLRDDDNMKYVVANRAPQLEVTETPWGTSYCATKVTDDDLRYLRIANFIFPFWAQSPQGPFETNVMARAWVPMDDTHTMAVTMNWTKRPENFGTLRDGSMLPGASPLRQQPNATGWYGRFRTVQNLDNDFEIDREAQRTQRNFTGIENIHVQDHAIVDSMGPVTDRTREQLVSSDVMVARTRRRLLRAARELASDGTRPPCADDPATYRLARSGEMVVSTHTSWSETYPNSLAAAHRLGENT